MRRSIPTWHRGTLFRSKLEADWARRFDAAGHRWEYEREGFYLGDVFYAPDFYLPDFCRWVEVKAVWDKPSVVKAEALCRHIQSIRPWDLPILHYASPGGAFGHFFLDHGVFCLCRAAGPCPTCEPVKSPFADTPWSGGQ